MQINKTPVRTSKSFNINEYELKNIPKKIGKFYNLTTMQETRKR